MSRKVNAETIEHVKRWEGCKLKAYPDPGSKDGNPWTIGYGHTSDSFMKVSRGMTITQAQADAALDHDLNETAAAVERLVKVPISDNQFGALTSMTFNIGEGAFEKSTLLKKLNKSDYASVPAEMARWSKNDGKVMSGLVNRRAAEAGLWAKGAFVASNTVEVQAQAPKWITPEAVGTVLTGAAGATGLATGNGPFQWALAIVFVIAAATAAFYFIRKRAAAS